MELMKVIETIAKGFNTTDRKLICYMLIDTIAAEEDTPVGEIYDQMKVMAVEIEKRDGEVYYVIRFF